MALTDVSWNFWYTRGQLSAKSGLDNPPYSSEALEAWNAGIADYNIRTANGKPVDQPNAGLAVYAASNENVGDVNSTARGTGARFTAGKAKLEYVPMSTLLRLCPPKDDDKHREDLRLIALAVAGFESRLDESGLFRAFQHIPNEFRYAGTCAQFDFGAKKYAAWNWAEGMAWSVPLACFKRHWIKLVEGEATDPESGVSHWGALGCNLVMLAHFYDYYKEGDDRPPASVFGKAD